MGKAPVLIHFLFGFSLRNHPAIGVPSVMETPRWIDMAMYGLVAWYGSFLSLAIHFLVRWWPCPYRNIVQQKSSPVQLCCLWTNWETYTGCGIMSLHNPKIWICEALGMSNMACSSCDFFQGADEQLGHTFSKVCRDAVLKHLGKKATREGIQFGNGQSMPLKHMYLVCIPWNWY